jgi:hypothetical protein
MYGPNNPMGYGRLWRLVETTILERSPWPWVRLVVTVLVVAAVFYMLRV